MKQTKFIRTIKEASLYGAKLGDMIEVKSSEMPKPVGKVKTKTINKESEE